MCLSVCVCVSIGEPVAPSQAAYSVKEVCVCVCLSVCVSLLGSLSLLARLLLCERGVCVCVCLSVCVRVCIYWGAGRS